MTSNDPADPADPDRSADAATADLRDRVETLERRHSAELTSPYWGTPIAAAGAALLTAALGLPWLVPDAVEPPSELYTDRWASGWTIVLGAIGDLGGDARISVAMLAVLAVPVAAALGFAAAIGRSRRVATFAVAFGCLAGRVRPAAARRRWCHPT